MIDAVMDEGSQAAAHLTPAPSESANLRVTGEIQSAPSRKTGKSLPASRGSIQIDAVLSDSYAQTPTAAPESQSPTPAAEPPISVPVAPPPSPAAAPARHQSGHFSPIESDFFAREADLYKVEGRESFADLDAPAGRSGKNGAGTKPSRK